MFTMLAQNTRKSVSAVAAIAIVSFGGLVLDQAHLAAAPRGTVEVGELTLIGGTESSQVLLPEVVVRAKREPHSFAATTQLPEIVVVAKRIAGLMAKEGQRLPSPEINASAEGALLN